MGASNLCVFQGRLGKDPEMIYTPNGVAVTKFSLAVDTYDYSTKTKGTMWLNVVCFNKTAERAAQFFRRGKPALVSGELRITEYQPKDQQQAKQKWVEIVAQSLDFVLTDNTSGQTTETAESREYAATPGDDTVF